MVLGKLDIQLPKNEIGPLPYTTHKNWLKIDEIKKEKKTVKILEKK